MIRRILALGALLHALVLTSSAFAAQNSVVLPTTGPLSMSAFVGTYLNPAMLSFLTCNSGNTPPTNGPASAPAQYQCWFDTSTSPRVLRYYDGSQWVGAFTFDTTGHSIAFTTSESVSARTTTTETIFDANKGQLVTFSNGSPIAASIGHAGTGGNFGAGWYADLQNLGAGALTITPTTSTIDNASSFVLQQRQGIRLVSDGTNYQVWRGMQVPAIACPNHQWVNLFSATGVPQCGQPAVADLSDAATLALLASPTFTGTPAAPTAAVDTNTTQVATTAFVLGQAAAANPVIDGTAAPGTSTRYARADHVHPTDTTRSPTASPTFTGTEDHQGTMKLSSFVTSTQITANQNNYTATDSTNTCATKMTLRVSSDASRNVTGLSCSQAEGDIRLIHNVGAQNIVLTNQDAGSTAANRFLFGSDMTLGADTSVTVRYDGVTSRWRAITSPGAGGGGGGVTSVGIAAGAGIDVSGTCTITASGTCTVKSKLARQFMFN